MIEAPPLEDDVVPLKSRCEPTDVDRELKLPRDLRGIGIACESSGDGDIRLLARRCLCRDAAWRRVFAAPWYEIRAFLTSFKAGATAWRPSGPNDMRSKAFLAALTSSAAVTSLVAGMTS